MKKPIEIFEDYLYKYLPDAYGFSGLKIKDINIKVNNYKKRFDNLRKIENIENINYTPHCIFDLLILAEQVDFEINYYKQFLKHINSIVVNLKNIVNKSLHSKLKETVKQMIISIDEEVGNNYQYLNFYGELLGLEFFITKDPKFKLIDIEKRLPNSKSVDYVFKNIDDETPLYVDFVNIHNIKPKLLETVEEFINFFEKKYNEKIVNKTKNLDFENNTLIIDENKIPFLIQPIVWGEINDFVSHRESIQIIDTKYMNVSKMTSLMVQLNSKNELCYDFTTVSNIIDRIIEENK